VTITIRRAGKPDIDAMTSLLQELFSIETDFVINIGKQKAGLMLLFADTDKGMVFVAADDQELAGMVTAQLVVSTAAGGHAALLEDMVVREKLRGRGIGAALLEAVQAWAAEKNAKRLQLLADERNEPALAFYKKLGFTGSRMRGFYLAGGGKQDDR